MFLISSKLVELHCKYLQGENGAYGKAGVDGKAGKQGVPGLPGARGEPGVQGEVGDPGLPGRDGNRGLPGTPGYAGEPVSNTVKGYRYHKSPSDISCNKVLTNINAFYSSDGK